MDCFLVHFLHLGRISFLPRKVNQNQAHLEANQDPHFKADQSSVVLVQSSYELSHHPKRTGQPDKTLQGSVITHQTAQVWKQP